MQTHKTFGTIPTRKALLTILLALLAIMLVVTPPVLAWERGLNSGSWTKGATLKVFVDPLPADAPPGLDAAIDAAIQAWNDMQAPFGGLMLMRAGANKENADIHISWNKDPKGSATNKKDSVDKDSNGFSKETVRMEMSLDGVNARGAQRDLTHELGHAEGLGHSCNSSCMKEDAYSSTPGSGPSVADLNSAAAIPSLNDDDKAGKKALWGTKEPLCRSQASSNATFDGSMWHYNFVIFALNQSGLTDPVTEFTLALPLGVGPTAIVNFNGPTGWQGAFRSGVVVPDGRFDDMEPPSPSTFSFFTPNPAMGILPGQQATFSIISPLPPATGRAFTNSPNWDSDESCVDMPFAGNSFVVNDPGSAGDANLNDGVPQTAGGMITWPAVLQQYGATPGNWVVTFAPNLNSIPLVGSQPPINIPQGNFFQMDGTLPNNNLIIFDGANLPPGSSNIVFAGPGMAVVRNSRSINAPLDALGINGTTNSFFDVFFAINAGRNGIDCPNAVAPCFRRVTCQNNRRFGAQVFRGNGHRWGDYSATGNTQGGLFAEEANDLQIDRFVITDGVGLRAIPAPPGSGVIGGNGGPGVSISNSNNVTIHGMYIGTNAAGNAANANTGDGINVVNSSNVVIGGANPGEGNLISGNTGRGINVLNGGAGIGVWGNFIGTNAGGIAAIPNGQGGVKLTNTSGAVIGATVAGGGNVISGNTGDGIGISSSVSPPTSLNNLIQGNIVGLNAPGNAKLGNGRMGISISSPQNIIGGTASGAGNVISGNTLSGIELAFLAATSATVQGNYIGVDSGATLKLGNGSDGITMNTNGAAPVVNPPGVLIGGSAAGARNIIGDNGLSGVDFFGNETKGIVQGNWIGTNPNGDNLGNDVGVLFTGDSFSGVPTGNLVGGTAAGEGNIIQFNKRPGVAANVAGAINNAVRGNSIASNGELGIDLGFDGVTANDAGDADVGANNLQNFPVLNLATSTGSGVQVQGTLNSTASTTFKLDFFASVAADPSGNGEGQTYLGSVNVTTNASGNVNFNVLVSTTPPAGQNIITSTATDPAGNTSEFSGSVQMTAPPTISINDVAVLEGNTGSGSVNFTVTLSAASAQAVTVQYATANGSATAPGDYTTASGTLTIPAGQTKGIITVPIVGDILDEADETFFVNLSAPTNATISDTQGRSIIVDNDAAPTLSINDVTLSEGTGTNNNAVFTVTLSAPSGQTISVNAITANGSARSPADYTGGGATLTFTAGQTSKTFSVPVIGDALDEDNENFFALLSSPVNASIARGRGTGTINDNDAAPSITIEDVNIGEGNVGQRTAVFRLHLSAPSGKLVKVNYATAAGTTNPAAAGTDYVAVTPTQIAFTTGQTITLARVLINGDTLNENDETFKVNLSGAVNATIADTQALGTILNDDPSPAIFINDVSIAEGNPPSGGAPGTKNLTFTVSLTVPSAKTITVNYATADGSARSTSDYGATNGTLTFAANQTSRTINVVINGDTVVEGNETFFVLLSSATNANISKARGTGTINNDDVSP